MPFETRLELLKRIEAERNSKALLFVSGDRPGLSTQLANDSLDLVTHHLDSFNLPERISIILYSRGGDVQTGVSIANLLRTFSKKYFEVIVPSVAHSSATLICLGANSIMMTKQATLSPVDPSLNGPLNPIIPGDDIQTTPVSVEEVAAFLQLAEKHANIKGEDSLKEVFLKLADHVHPLVLGRVYRTRQQIQMIAQKLLRSHMSDEDKIKKIVSFVCSDSGSHDYMIYRKEARESLQLPIENPTQNFYDTVLKPLHQDFRQEMELNNRYEPEVYLGTKPSGDFSFPRFLIESVSGGQHMYQSRRFFERNDIHVQTPLGEQIKPRIIQKNLFEGWLYSPTRS
jgi:hypothetical protein